MVGFATHRRVVRGARGVFVGVEVLVAVVEEVVRIALRCCRRSRSLHSQRRILWMAVLGGSVLVEEDIAGSRLDDGAVVNLVDRWY